MEEQQGNRLFTGARHPYTQGLLACSPELGQSSRPLSPIPGRPPSLADAFTGCPFASRCAHADAACETWQPGPVSVGGGGTAACRRLPEPRTPSPRPAAQTTGSTR
ncbi:oligopeptide/dipeptide ABC transporter ATP-binding protein [Streptomyces nodosus]|uniref:oligopeptide/dipeptide ABC transporter ATP-binding protein n=1 Tax=Streptomyces nodosus TaxID=40318 RepID=UPI003828F9A1